MNKNGVIYWREKRVEVNIDVYNRTTVKVEVPIRLFNGTNLSPTQDLPVVIAERIKRLLVEVDKIAFGKDEKMYPTAYGYDCLQRDGDNGHVALANVTFVVQ